jgi:hypothetical protein
MPGTGAVHHIIDEQTIRNHGLSIPVIASQAQQSILLLRLWIASRSLSSGAHSRDPLARNDGNQF